MCYRDDWRKDSHTHARTHTHVLTCHKITNMTRHRVELASLYVWLCGTCRGILSAVKGGVSEYAKHP